MAELTQLENKKPGFKIKLFYIENKYNPTTFLKFEDLFFFSIHHLSKHKTNEVFGLDQGVKMGPEGFKNPSEKIIGEIMLKLTFHS